MASMEDIIVWIFVAASIIFAVGLAIATEFIAQLHGRRIERREREAMRRRRYR